MKPPNGKALIERSRAGLLAVLKSAKVRRRPQSDREFSLDLDGFKRQFGSALDEAPPTVLSDAVWEFYGKKAADRSRALNDVLSILTSRHRFLAIDGPDAAAGLSVVQGRLVVWAMDPTAVVRPILIRVLIDGKLEFERRTDPTLEQPVYATGYELRRYRGLELRADDHVVAQGPFEARPLWDDPSVRQGLANYLNWVGQTCRQSNLRNELWFKLSHVMARLDRSPDGALARVPAYCRYLGARLGSGIKLGSPLSVANWVVSDVFENPNKRAIFCLTDRTLGILREPVFNRQAVKTEISLALFAFWRRHYANVDVFTEEGLRAVQYKFVTAPFISDKNNALLVPDDLRKAMSDPAEGFRARETPWSWFWVALLKDQGQAERMKDEAFSKLTSFKETALDVAVPGRLSFSPQAWRAYWSAPAIPPFTRFDMAVISILANAALAEVALAERGEAYWQGRLNAEVYAKVPALSALSGIPQQLMLPGPTPSMPMRDLVIIGHANQTGLGRNLTMFVEGLAAFDPVVLSADDGSCVNPTPDYRPEIGVRARTVLLCVNAHRAPEMIARFASVCEGAHVIGFYVWETDQPPESHVLGSSVVDEIWAPTNYVVDAYRKITSVPVHLVKKGLHPPKDRSPFLDRFRRSPDAFLFLCVADFGSSIVRKNPLDAIKAFQLAFADSTENVRLLVKIRQITPGHWSNFDGYWEDVAERVETDDRIDFVEGDLTEQEYWTLIKTVDCVVSLHKSEGFGYSIADAMMAGKSVIVSNHSGSQDFCDESTSFPVAVEMAAAPPEHLASQGVIGHWAIPDVASAAQAMRRAFGDPATRETRAEAGRIRILRDYGFEQWRNAISERLRAVSVAIGER